MSEYQITVSFKLYGFEFEHARISKALKIEPTYIWKKGEAVSTGSSLINEDNGWILELNIAKSEPLDVHIKAFFSILHPIQKEISTFTRMCGAELGIVIYMQESAPEIHFSPDILSFLSSLRCEVDIDIYGD